VKASGCFFVDLRFSQCLTLANSCPRKSVTHICEWCNQAID